MVPKAATSTPAPVMAPQPITPVPVPMAGKGMQTTRFNACKPYVRPTRVILQRPGPASPDAITLGWKHPVQGRYYPPSRAASVTCSLQWNIWPLPCIAILHNGLTLPFTEDEMYDEFRERIIRSCLADVVSGVITVAIKRDEYLISYSVVVSGWCGKCLVKENYSLMK